MNKLYLWLFILIFFVNFLFASNASRAGDVGNTRQNINTRNSAYLIENLNNPVVDINLSISIPPEKIGTFTNNQILLCDKKLGGSFEYLNSSSIRFFIETKLSSSQSYKCKVNKAFFKAINKEITINTKEFLVESSHFIDQIDSFVIKLNFNDTVNYTSLKDSISLTNNKNLQVNYQVFPKEDSKIYTIIYDSNEKLVNLKLKNLKNSSFKFLNYENSYDNTNKVDNALSRYDIEKFPLIPIYNEDGTISLEFKYMGEINNRNVKDYIEISPKVKFYVRKENVDYTEETRLTLNGDFNPNFEYQVNFKKGLKFYKDSYLYELKEDNIKTVIIGNRKSFVSFVDSKDYISSKATDILIKSVNVDEIEVVVDKLIDDNLRYYVDFEYYVDFGAYDDYDYNFYKYSEVVFNKKIKINCQKNEICQTPISMQNIINSKSGVYRIKLLSSKKDLEGDSDSDNRYIGSRFLNFSDIAIGVKLFKDEVFVTTTSLDTNAPLYNATISIYDDKNREILKGKSDFFGIFRGKLKNLVCKKPRFAIVDYNGEKNYVVFKEAVNSFNIDCDYFGNDKLDSFIYLDREIARPNDKLNALFVLKDNNFKSKSNVQLTIKIEDPNESEVFKKVLKTDEFGIIESDINIPSDFKTGRYKITVDYFKTQIGFKEFFVEDFIPHKIENSLSLDKKSYFIEDKIKVKVGSKYLFGTPASNLQAEVSLSMIDKEFKSKKYPDYLFTNKNLYESYPKLDMDKITKIVTLDKDGYANVMFEQNFTNVDSIMQGMISLTVFDDGRGISKYETFDIYNYKNLVGIKRVNSGYGESGHEESFKLALIDTNETDITPRALKVEIKKAIWHYSSDAYDMESITQMSISSNEEIKFTPESSGEYIISVSDPLYGHTSSSSFYVSGWSYDPIQTKEVDKEVEILVEEKLYKAGDEIKVGIKSPLAGRMIVTMEDSKILEYKVVDLKNNTAALNLQIPYGVTDSFYIKAYITRDAKENDIVVPFRAFGKVLVKIDKLEHNAKVDFEIKPRYVSKSKAKFEVSTNVENGYVILSVVDMGILNIIDQTPPDPFEFFLTKEYETSSIYDFYNNLVSHIIKKIDKYGSGVSLHAKMKKHLPPDSLTKKRVKPFSFYSKKVKIENKKAIIDVDIPNFNGSARVVAIVVGEDEIGSASKEITVKDDVIVKSTFPRFFSLGDELLVPVRFFNTTDETKELTLSTSNKNMSCSIDKNLTLNPNSSEIKYLTLKALNTPSGYIKIVATSKDNKIYFDEVDMPIRDTKFLKSFTKGGDSKDEVNFSLSKEIFQSNPYVNVAISSTYLSEFIKSFNYLVEYPYGCLEQTSSKILALLNIEKFLDKDDKNYENKLKESNFYVVAGVDKLSRMQMDDGQFTYWDSGDYINDFASIYASDVLLEANEKKFEVNDNVITKIYQALDNYARYLSDDNSNKLYSLYVLAKYNNVDLALINSMYDNGSYYNSLLDHYIMAALLNKVNLTKEYEKVYEEIKNYDLSKNLNSRTYGGNFYSYIKDVAFSLYIHLENFPKDEISDRLLEIIVKYIREDRLYSTQDISYVLRAMNSYYKNQVSADLNTTLLLNSKKFDITKPKTISEKLKENFIKVIPNANTTVNYLIEVNYYAEYEKRKINIYENKSEIAIDSYFYGADGKIVDKKNIKVGDKIYLEISLRSKRLIENVVVNAQIPSNFEIVNIRLDKDDPNSTFKNQNFTMNYFDIRDDRELVFLNVNGYVKFYIPLRAVSKGISKVPPITVEAMYDSRINDYTKEFDTIEVK